MGETTAPGAFDYLTAWVGNVPAGTDIGFGQKLPSSLSDTQIKNWIAPQAEKLDPRLVTAIKNKDVSTLESMGIIRQDGFFDIEAAKKYASYPDWYNNSWGGA